MENRPKKRKSNRKFHKVSVSLNPETLPAAKKRAQKLGFTNSFSAYVQKLVDDDLEQSAEAAKYGGDTIKQTKGMPPKLQLDSTKEEEDGEDQKKPQRQ